MREIYTRIGKLISWLSVALMLLICTDVFLRYLFNSTKVWIIDLEWHLFALIFLLAAAWSYQKDRHVRVDVFYQRWSPKRKAIVDLLGNLLLLVPWTLLIIYTSSRYAWHSWEMHEGSPDPGGLPARYVIKFAIPIGFMLLLLACMASILDDWKKIRNKS